MKIKAMLITLALTLAVIVSCVCVSADGAKITVSIANGTLVLTEAAVDVTEIDGDGALTITPTAPTVMLPQTEIMALR